MTARAKLLRTSTFRLAALYLILFAVSVAALLGYVYWNTAVLLQEQTDYTIQAEVQALSDQYQLQAEAFGRVIRKKQKPFWGVEDAIQNMKIIDALFRSEKSGKWEKP